MKKIVLQILAILLAQSLLASPIDQETAKKIGENFLNERIHLQKGLSVNSVSIEFLIKHTSAFHRDLFYIFNIREVPGFIIISADDDVFPVIGYSFESTYDLNEKNKPESFVAWFEASASQLEFVKDNKLTADETIRQQWKKLDQANLKMKNKLANVDPLLTTTWNQGTYYNTLCPVGTGGQNGHLWVGCVAVSMAQVMKYWNYPQFGSGQNTYECSPYGTQSANFAETQYNWQAMPNSLSSENLSLATLLYHCGVAVNMHYAPGGSGAYMSTAAMAFKKYFDYSHQIKLLYRSSYTPQAWDSIIRSEIDLGQPIAYAGGNHAFNIDGYQGNDYFHVNWGWGGSYNGYFYFSALNPGSSNFTSGQHAILGIKPNCGESDDALSTITAYSGTITDNGGISNNYMNCSETKTLIAPSGVSQIKLMFSEFKTLENQDTLYVYNGANETAPLLATLSGDIAPFELISTANKVFLKFKSNGFSTSKGYSANYISAYHDTGITGLISPTGKTCGIANDSIRVIVKNFGISTKINIPVTVKIKTPSGTETYTKNLSGPLATNQSDTLFVHLINTSMPGNYSFTSYTRTTGDVLVNENDTIKSDVEIKTITLLPFAENVDSMHYQMGDWFDKNRKTYIYSDYEIGNCFFRSYVGGGVVGGGSDGEKQNEQFLIHDRKVGPITKNAFLYFDYRILAGGQQVSGAELTENEKIHVLISGDCGKEFDTIFTIDASMHQTSADFTKLKLPLVNYTGQQVLIGFTTKWDSNFTMVDYDNFLMVDSVGATGFEQIDRNNEYVNVFPNPGKDVFYVDLPFAASNAVIELIDLSGKLVHRQNIKFSGHRLSFNIAGQKPGIYLIKFTIDKKLMMGRLMKE